MRISELATARSRIYTRQPERDSAMKAYLNAILFFAFLSASGFAVRFLFLSDVVPVSEGDQTRGRVLAAFILRSIENTGWFGLLITLLFGLGWLVARSIQRRVR